MTEDEVEADNFHVVMLDQDTKRHSVCGANVNV